MRSKYGIASLAIIGSTVIFGVIHQSLRTKYAEVVQITINLDKQNDILIAQVMYLLNVLNENDIELDEFDLIALNHADLE